MRELYKKEKNRLDKFADNHPFFFALIIFIAFTIMLLLLWETGLLIPLGITALVISCFIGKL